ncbi:MAG: pilus assembly protein [Alphaproteobacteria bacterium]|nr:pilus assembly protein [Alphaproteobacteria bacterium]
MVRIRAQGFCARLVRTCESCSDLARENGGSALIEFALLAPLYLAITVATLQIGILYFDQQAIQTAADKIARQEMTGQLTFDTTGMTAAQISSQTAAAFAADLNKYLNSPIDPTQVNVNFVVGNNFSSIASADTSSSATYNAQGQLVTSGYTSSSLVQPCQYGVLKLYYNAPTMFLTGPSWLGMNFNIGDSRENRQLVGTAVFKSEAFQGAKC